MGIAMKRSGFADLPLHGGHVPAWLAERMTKLGTAIAESILYHYGPSELLSRLSDPFWFQALGCVMGMDWHSSGITTSVLGALKRGLNPRAGELGIYVCGGRGRHSRHTPDELRTVADRHSLDGEALVRTSRLTAKAEEKPKRVKSTSPPPVRLALYFRRALTHYGTSGPFAFGRLRKRLTQRRDNRVHPGAFFVSSPV